MDTAISKALRTPVALTLIRLVVVFPFLMGGISKLTDFGGTLWYVSNGTSLFPMPLPSLVAILVIALEIGAPVLVVLNRWFAALAAIALAVFCVLSGVIYHLYPGEAVDLGAQMNMIVAMKNFAWAGGLLGLAALAHRGK